MNIGTLNTRTLKSEDRIEELMHELQNINWDIIGLSEVRRKRIGTLNLHLLGHLLFYSGTEVGRTSGVGFIINRKWVNHISNMQGITGRMATPEIELSKRYSMQIIQIYAPTIEYPDEEIEELYSSISRNLGDSKNYFKNVMGDFNTKVGTKVAEEKTVGEHGYGPRNSRGSRMVGFTKKENLFIMDTFFKQRSANKKGLGEAQITTHQEIIYYQITEISLKTVI